MNKNKLNKVINIFSLVLIAIGFYFLFRKGDWSKVFSIKDNINYGGLAAVIIIVVVCQFLVVFRWYLLLVPIKKGIKLQSIYRIAVSSIVLNQTAPGKVGYPTKAYFLKKMENIPISSSIPSLFGELFLDYSITTVFFLVTAFIGGYFKTIFNLLSNYIDLRNIWIVPLCLTLFIILFILFRKKIQSLNITKNIIAAVQVTRKRFDLILWSIVLTFVFLFIWFISDYIVLLSLGFKVPLNFVIFVGAFTNIIVLLAPLPGGLGVREITGAYLFKIFFNLGEIAVIMILLNRLISYLALAILYMSERIFRPGGSEKEVIKKIVDPEMSRNLL